jgi:predicted nucleic acid-binding protein
MVVFDANYLIHLLHPNPGQVIDPQTEKPVDRIKERIEYLVECLDKAQEKIIVPTPVLSEVFSLSSDKAHDYLALMQSTYRFELASFDPMAAIEAGLAHASAKVKGDKREGADTSWAKVKFDRQIVAIAKTRQATTIYSNDKHIRTLGAREGIAVISVWELPDPPPQQSILDFDPAENSQQVPRRDA